MIEKLLDLQNRIYQYHNSKDFEYILEYSPRISFSRIGALYEIVFYGEGYDDDSKIHSSEFEPKYLNYGFCALLDFLIANPKQFVSLIFTGPDEGANGTKNWDFSRLTHSQVIFENLEIFKVALTDVGDHNQSIIGKQYDEDGMIAKLLAKMPQLQTLVLPSAPNQDFFTLPKLKINSLVIQAGYDPQNFIENLAQADILPNLKSLDYAEPYDHFGDRCEDEFTSFEAFEKLFNKLISYKHFHFKLRENRLTQTQLEVLQKIGKVQFLHIKTEIGKYIRV